MPFQIWRPEPLFSLYPFVIDLESSDFPNNKPETWTSEANVPAIYTVKSVNTAETPRKRLLLSIYEYLSVHDVETSAAAVCKAWYHVSKDPEHWKSRFLSDIHPSETDSESDYRRRYIFYALAVCWHCSTVPPIGQIALRCPLLKRPLCWKCARKGECQIESFTHYSRTHSVSSTVLAQLTIPAFDHYQGKSSYVLYFRRELTLYAAIRREILLRTVDQEYPGRLSSAVREAIVTFDLWKFYGKARPRPGSLVVKALVRFCGKCGRREGENVRIFLRDAEKA